ncbi:MAG: DNA polymerase III subunit beta [Candidatus Sumerlaeia bacterium]
MKLRFEKNVLANAVAVTHGVANPNSSLAVLGNILITANDDGTALFEASDMESCVRCNVQCEMTESGAVTVNAKRIRDIVSSLPSGTVELDFSGTQARIACEGKVYTLTTQSAEDWPDWPELNAGTTLELENKNMRRILDHILFALPQRDPRKVLLGSLFDIKDNELICVTTDGKKLGLSRCSVPEIEGIQPAQAIIPGKILNEVHRNLGDEGSLKLRVGERQVAFEMGNIVYLSNRIDGIFPNYEMVIPQEADFVRRIPFNRAELINEVQRASRISEERNNSIIMRFEPGKVDFTSRTMEVGSYHGSINIDYDGEAFDIAFNHIFLTDCLKVVESEKLIMKIKQNTAPVVFVMPDDDQSIFLVMPIKLTDIAEYSPNA